MNTRYFVEGRRFDSPLHAVTFADGQAQTMGRPVEVKAEVYESVEKCRRHNLATMYPTATKPLIEKNSPKENFVAPAEAVS